MPELLQPRTLSQLTEALGTRGRLLVAAGGTDLLVRLRLHPSGEATVLDLSAMSDLRGVTEEGAFLRIGAMTTLTALNQCPLAQSRVPVLAEAAGMVGSTQIRNRATVGGNVANAAQCADTIPALIALEAEAELMNSAGALRRVPVADFVTGIGRTLITEHEVLTGFLIAPEMQGLRGLRQDRLQKNSHHRQDQRCGGLEVRERQHRLRPGGLRLHRSAGVPFRDGVCGADGHEPGPAGAGRVSGVFRQPGGCGHSGAGFPALQAFRGQSGRRGHHPSGCS